MFRVSVGVVNKGFAVGWGEVGCEEVFLSRRLLPFRADQPEFLFSEFFSLEGWSAQKWLKKKTQMKVLLLVGVRLGVRVGGFGRFGIKGIFAFIAKNDPLSYLVLGYRFMEYQTDISVSDDACEDRRLSYSMESSSLP